MCAIVQTCRQVSQRLDSYIQSEHGCILVGSGLVVLCWLVSSLRDSSRDVDLFARAGRTDHNARFISRSAEYIFGIVSTTLKNCPLSFARWFGAVGGRAGCVLTLHSIFAPGGVCTSEHIAILHVSSVYCMLACVCAKYPDTHTG